MSLDLLDTPVRLTWDLHGPGEPLSDEEMLAIAGRIADGGVFYVTLEVRPLAHSAIAPLARRLTAGGCQLLAVCTGAEAELAALECCPLPLRGVWLDVAPFLSGSSIDWPRLRQTLERLRRTGVEPTLSLIPLRSHLSVIPKLLAACRDLGVGCFKLPNARIDDTFQAGTAGELPRWQDLEDYRNLWLSEGPEAGQLPLLEIHDRFLWEIMTPGIDQARSEYDGCQAANSLGHVDARGTVYACAAWPCALGSLFDADLEQIWQSPKRFLVRERIGQAPAGCLGCRDYALCLGGCRGLGERINRAAGGRDLMCREPRN